MNGTTRFLLGINQVKRTVRNKVRKDKDVIYGGQALNSQVIGVARIPTVDFDIYSRSPRKRAFELDRVLDRQSGGDHFDVRPAEYRGTHKVFHRGTRTTVADYSPRPKGRLPIRVINGVQYLALGEVASRRRKILRRKKFAFRHQKDKRTLFHIRVSNKFKRLVR